MKKIRDIIIIIAIIIVIILLIVLKLILSGKEDNDNNADQKLEINSIFDIDTTISPVQDATQFFSISSSIRTYLNYITSQDAQAVYSLLDEEYIDELNITEDNVLDNVEQITEMKIFQAKQMYIFDALHSQTYFVYGTIRTDVMEGRGEEEDFYITVYIDLVNLTFSIIPNTIESIQNIDELYNDYDVNQEAKENPSNQYNSFRYNSITDATLSNTYLNDYKTNVLYNVEQAYNSLDKEYREKRFGSLNEYKKYIEENLDILSNITLAEYQVSNTDDYMQYSCIDNNGDYYIFRETATMQYTLILDTYTIDLPEFLEKYNSTNEQGKLALNIQKFVDSINNKDYKYAYSKLANGFKSNYFPTLNSFKTYIEQNMYDRNEVSYLNFSEEAGLYTYSVRFSNPENSTDGIVNKTFIIKLGEGTDFELSFNTN